MEKKREGNQPKTVFVKTPIVMLFAEYVTVTLYNKIRTLCKVLHSFC